MGRPVIDPKCKSCQRKCKQRFEVIVCPHRIPQKGEQKGQKTAYQAARGVYLPILSV